MSEPAAYPSETETPVCPRHPTRVSYVRCQRCGRPVCPECQRPAAVGVQCVDCVREGQRSVRQASTIFGGRPTGGSAKVTLGIIVICAVVWLLQLQSQRFFFEVAFYPALGETEPWRLLTSAFAHSTSPMHILFNMLALWTMGSYLEPLLGRARFLAVYLVSALAGSVVYLVLSDPSGRSWITPVVGASGAVFGLFGAFLVINRRLDRSNAGMAMILVINAVLGFVLPNVAWQAHLGGLLAGAAAAGVIAYGGRGRDRRLHWVGLAVLVAVLVVAAVLKYAAAPA